MLTLNDYKILTSIIDKEDKKVETLKFNTFGEWLDYLDKEFYKTFE